MGQHRLVAGFFDELQKLGVKIHLVDGGKVKTKHDMDFVEGGHDKVYKWIPKDEVWVDKHLDASQRPYVAFHELVERARMAKGESYDKAHVKANAAEKDMREKKATLIGHIAGPAGSGKTHLLRQLQEKHPGLVAKDTDEFLDEIYARHPKMDREERHALHAQMSKEFLEKHKDKPVLFGGYGTKFADKIGVPENRRWMLNTSPLKSAWRATYRANERPWVGPIGKREHIWNVPGRYLNAIRSIKKIRARGYIPISREAIMRIVSAAMTKKASDVLYHGSPKKLKILVPKNLHGDPDVASAVFATPSREFALPYAGGKWGDRDINQNTQFKKGIRKVILQEMRPGAFKDIFEGRKGYMYHVPEETFKPPAHRKPSTWEVISEKPVKPIKVEEILDVSKALRESGVDLLPYDLKETLKVLKRRDKRTALMTPEKQLGYWKWWLEKAPPEVAAELRKRLSS